MDALHWIILSFRNRDLDTQSCFAYGYELKDLAPEPLSVDLDLWMENWNPQAAVAKNRAGFTSSLGRRVGCLISDALPDYYGFRDSDSSNPLFDEMVDFESVEDCGNLRLTHVAIPMGGNNGRFYDMEHTIDGNLIGQFMTDAAAGRLRSGATARSGAVSMSFFRQVRTMPLPVPPPLPGGFNPPRLLERVMECLGGRDNTASFVSAHQDINAVKTAVRWRAA
ncbi:hypothetical protein LZ31DRAFT_559155 [Colletotrichum somersetense]|nr:hypothetical protein LZ31DRAFT_559155 [Colletotrichum somersetense]